MIYTLMALLQIFLLLSVLAFGGVVTVLPEIQRQVVQVEHWMTPQEFSTLFALAQASPGPNSMIVPLIGWNVAGLGGLLVSSLAIYVPSIVITAGMLRIWDRYQARPWRRLVQNGLLPVTTGLVAASALLITRAAAPNLLMLAVTALSAWLALRTRIHPLWLLLGGSLIGWATQGGHF